MPKLLIRKEHRKFVEDLDREVTISKLLQYYVTNLDKDFQTRLGVIPKKELKKKSGSIVKTTTGKEFVLLEAGFIDQLKRIKRLPQTMPLKDMGSIIAETGVNKDSTVVDCGTGSGALACFLSHHCKNVVTFDTREEHLAVAKENAKMLNLNNITFKQHDVTKSIPEKNADLITLDIPEPDKAVQHALKAVNIGGYIVAYTIQATQLQAFVNTAKKHPGALVVKSIELLERLWKADGKILRPHNIPLGHSGFLTFVRRIQ